MTIAALLALRWSVLAAQVGLHDVGHIGGDLILRYSEPHRRFHTCDHLWFVLRHLEAADAPPLLHVAAWFHDAVYDPMRQDNEARSADLAWQQLISAGMPAASVSFVTAAVMATAAHRHDGPQFSLLLDADMSILGAPAPAYAEYIRAIREEYQAVPEAAFRAGRGAFLRATLAQPAIFGTPHFRDKLETLARSNLAAEAMALVS